MRNKSIALSALLVITALSGCIGGHDDEEYEFHGLEFDPASPAPDFTLIDQNGNEVSMSDFDDKVVVLAFTYTACPDICLTIEANLHHINTEMADEEDLVILSMTIDPVRDTPEHLWGWTNVRGYDWPHLTSHNHSELAVVWDLYHVVPDTDHINSDHSDHDHHDGHGDHDEHDDNSDMSHQVAILYPDNSTALLDGSHDMLPEENATGWNLTETTMSINDVALNYSVHEQYGHSVTGINGVDSPSDWSWWWSLYIWNETNSSWDLSDVGVDEVMIMQHTDHVAWAASNANLSMLPTPDDHDGHDDHDDHDSHGDDDEMHGEEEMYEVGHQTVIYIIDKDGNKRLVFTGLEYDLEDVMDDLNHLLHHDTGVEAHDDHSGHDHH